ncbi:MAG: MaoC/PaaZ C-terminal domain-containing protein [Suilimivivens sp.]
MNHYSYKDIYVGQEEKFCVEITEDSMAAFCKLSGDENPLHVDSDYAKSKGYQGKVVYGMLMASYLSTLAGMYIPGKYSLIHSVEIKFHKPVYVENGDRLLIRGKVVDKNDLFRLLIVKVTIENGQGVKVCKGKMQIGVIDEE